MERIRRKVDLILIVTDACTGFPVEHRECRAGVRGGGEVVAKPGGFYVLTDLPGGRTELWVEGRGYQRTELTVEVCDRKTVYVFLIPDRERIRGKKHITVLSGMCTGKRLTVAAQRKGVEGRIAADMEPGQDHIALCPSLERKEGRGFFLSGVGGAGERIVLGKENGQDGGCFSLTEPVRSFYPRNRTKVCTLFDVPLRQDGSYYLPFTLFPEENGLCRVWVDGAAREIPDLREGEENRADW